MKVTIFGATGFSGQAILAEALKQGHEVTILVRDTSKISIQHKNLTIVEGNVLDPQTVASILHHQEAVIQCLGVGGKGDGKPSTFISDATKVIVDEMQNLTFEEIDTVMTRVGYRSKILWCGDYRQTDLNKKRNDMSGILKFFDIAHHMGAFTKIEFTPDDIVRSSLVKDYILAKLKYEDYN